MSESLNQMTDQSEMKIALETKSDRMILLFEIPFQRFACDHHNNVNGFMFKSAMGLQSQ